MLCYHLVRRLVVLLEHLQQVAGDSPGYSRDAEMWRCTHHAHTFHGKAGGNGQPGCCLCKSGIQETVGYAGGKLPAGVASDWVTRRSPSSVLRRFEGEHRVFLPRPLTSLHVRNGGSMYSLACMTPGIIPWNYCSLRDHGILKRVPWEAWTLQ